MMLKHYVRFSSPGTFVSETTEKEIDSWDVSEAVKMSKEIVERYDSRPYGFHFYTMERKEDDWEPKKIASSPFYYLGGRIETRKQVIERDDPKENILRQNMEFNDIDRIVVNETPWRSTMPFRKGDVLLNLETLEEVNA